MKYGPEPTEPLSEKEKETLRQIEIDLLHLSDQEIRAIAAMAILRKNINHLRMIKEIIKER